MPLINSLLVLLLSNQLLIAAPDNAAWTWLTLVIEHQVVFRTAQW